MPSLQSQELFFSERALSDGVSAATVALTGSTVVLRDVEQLCSAIVMNDVLDRFVDQLKSDNYKANKVMSQQHVPVAIR